MDTNNKSAAPTPIWHGVSDPAPDADSNPLPPAEKLLAVDAGELMKRVTLETHAAVERLADSIEPTVRQLAEGVSLVEDAVGAKTDEIRKAGDEWAESLRCTVRGNPLKSMAAAVALGALVARMVR